MEQRILIVDSHPVYGKKLVAFLESLTFKNIGLAQTGEKALAEISAYVPELVIISSLLMDMNSADLCQKIQEAGAKTKIIVQTGLFTGPADIELFKRHGAHCVLERKEKDWGPLQKAVEELLLNSATDKYYKNYL